MALSPEPLHFQVAELPEIRATVTDHVQHRKTCPCCRTTSTARLPDDVPATCFGPNLRALLVLLGGRYRICRRETVELCKDLFDLSVSVGGVANVIQRMSQALAAPHEEAARAVRQAPVAYVDETGWREKSRALNLWIAVTAVIAFFRIGRRTKEMHASGFLCLPAQSLPPSLRPRDIDSSCFSIVTASGSRAQEQLWNEYVERYHYLRYGVPVWTFALFEQLRAGASTICAAERVMPKCLVLPSSVCVSCCQSGWRTVSSIARSSDPRAHADAHS